MNLENLLEAAIENTDMQQMSKEIAKACLSIERQNNVVGIYRDNILKGVITDEKLNKIKIELKKLLKEG